MIDHLVGARVDSLEPLDEDMSRSPGRGDTGVRIPLFSPYREDTPPLTVVVEHRHPSPSPISTTAPTSSVA